MFILIEITLNLFNRENNSKNFQILRFYPHFIIWLYNKAIIQGHLNHNAFESLFKAQLLMFLLRVNRRSILATPEPINI